MYSDFVFLDRFLFELSCKNTHTNTHRDSNEYPIVAFSKNATIINCQDCNEFYIGLTTRRLHKRLNEHKKRTYCALYKLAETGHVLDFVNPEIIGNDHIKLRLQGKEALQIYQYSANKSLNVIIDSFECKLW